MRLSEAKFNAHLANIGQSFGWRKAYACPCFNPDSGAAKFNCVLCMGKGWTWTDEVPGIAGMTNQSASKMMAQFGVFEAGDAILVIGSASPIYNCGRFDRIRALNSSNPFSELLTRGENDVLNGTIVSVDRVFWLNDAQDTVLEGGIPSVNDDGTLTWSSGEPPAGTQYSIAGVRFDEYYVYPTLATDRNAHQGAALPRKLMVRRFDLFGR